MRFNFRSQSLQRNVDVTIVYPTDIYTYKDLGSDSENSSPIPFERVLKYVKGMKLQTVYLIHGGGDDDTLTYRYTNAERYAQRNNVMLVTPNIANSFGIDTVYGAAFQTFISEELPVIIQSLFSSSSKQEDTFIIGYAMGGNAALGAAMRHPEIYHTCVDISGGIGMTLDTGTLVSELNGDHFRNNFPLYNSSFGPSCNIEGSSYDIYSLAKKNIDAYFDEAIQPPNFSLPKFCLICGSLEFIRSRVEKDAQILNELGYEVEYILAEGFDHDFKLWDRYIEIALDKLLPLKRLSNLLSNN